MFIMMNVSRGDLSELTRFIRLQKKIIENLGFEDT